MALSYTALIRPIELKRAAALTLGNAVNDAIDAGAGDLYDAAVEAIEGATETIESYLGRQLIVRSQTLVFCDANWKARAGYENSDEDILFSAWARQWPVLEVVSVDTETTWAGEITLQEARHDGQYLSYDPDSTLVTEPPYQVVAFCGYRRTDQDLTGTGGNTDLNTITGLSALTVLPAVVPYDIRRVCTRLAVRDLRQHQLGLVGLSAVNVQADRLTANAVLGQFVDPKFVVNELAALYRYRYVPT